MKQETPIKISNNLGQVELQTRSRAPTVITVNHVL